MASGRGKMRGGRGPVGPGSGDREFRSLIDHVVVPLARMYSPQLLLISAGFDAHVDDPLADCRVTDDGYAAMARSLQGVARELEVPVGAVLEGGYALDALARSVAATMAVLGGVPEAEGGVGVADVSGQALERLAEFWPGLG